MMMAWQCTPHVVGRNSAAAFPADAENSAQAPFLPPLPTARTRRGPLIWSFLKENGPCTVQKKKTLVANWTSGPVCQCTGVVPARSGQRLGRPCRRAPDPSGEEPLARVWGPGRRLLGGQRTVPAPLSALPRWLGSPGTSSLPWAPSLPPPLGEVPQCAHWGGEGSPSGTSAPRQVRSSVIPKR